jgi:peptidoglycan/LPS O-acetylase OafA/YrhL
MKLRKELLEVHFLRGIASVAVCLFHLVLGNGQLFSSNNFLKQIFSNAYSGVEIFFILSGYVICYSFPANFAYKEYGTFISKRLVRVEPPFIASFILVLVLNFISHKVTGTGDPVGWSNVFFHIGYLNNFGFGTYLNPVYWTLGIELQYYVCIGLLFPLIRDSKSLLRVMFVIFLLIGFIKMPSNIYSLITYISYFSLGILLFFFKKAKLLAAPEYVLLTLLFLTEITIHHGWFNTFLSLFAVLVLLFWNYTNKFIQFFSMISFSLYLTHTTIGGKVINLGLRFVHSDTGKSLLFVAALVISIAFALAFYWFVEKPSLKLAKRFTYKSRTIETPALAIKNA